MDGNKIVATLNKGDQLHEEIILKEEIHGNQKVIDARQDESSTFRSDSPSPPQNIDKLESVSPSNIEYLDDTEDEFRLTESIQRSKGKGKIRMATIQISKEKAGKPKGITLIKMKKKTAKKRVKEQNDKDIQYHHENLRTVLRCSNATTFSFRGIWYLCTLCHTKHTDPKDLKAHALKDHSTLKSQENLYLGRHLQRYVVKLDITNLKCKLCSIEISSLKDLMEHLYSQHGEPIHMELPNHMIPFKFDGDVLRCTECDREFPFFKSLQCHMNDHYKNFTCEVCDTGYVSYGSLAQHKRLHADGEYTCKWCQKLFVNKLRLADHIKLVHFGQNKRNKCAYCDMKFLVFEARNKHMEEEHGLKAPVVQCQACEKTFSSTRLLTAHMKKHHLVREKNHACSLCDRRFVHLYLLKEHMAVHSGEKNFKCIVCDKAFSRQKTLREHIRIHANDRRFRCEHCGMAFVQKCSLNGHLKSKHPDKEQKYTDLARK